MDYGIKILKHTIRHDNAWGIKIQKMQKFDLSNNLIDCYFNKTLPSNFPAARYWLQHESDILQGFNQHPNIVSFRGLCEFQLNLSTAYAGESIASLLKMGAVDYKGNSLVHPFQQSGELIKLFMAVCKAVKSIHENGVIHCDLNHGNICLRINKSGHVDYDSVVIIDFSNSFTSKHPILKPLFIDYERADTYFPPAFKKAVKEDWAEFSRQIGEPGIGGYHNLSPEAKRIYSEEFEFQKLLVNEIDWRADLYSLGYWFGAISRQAIIYETESHQIEIPQVIRRMQQTSIFNRFKNMDAVISKLQSLSISGESPVVTYTEQLSPSAMKSSMPTPINVKKPDQKEPISPQAIVEPLTQYLDQYEKLILEPLAKVWKQAFLSFRTNVRNLLTSITYKISRYARSDNSKAFARASIVTIIVVYFMLIFIGNVALPHATTIVKKISGGIDSMLAAEKKRLQVENDRMKQAEKRVKEQEKKLNEVKSELKALNDKAEKLADATVTIRKKLNQTVQDDEKTKIVSKLQGLNAELIEIIKKKKHLEAKQENEGKSYVKK